MIGGYTQPLGNLLMQGWLFPARCSEMQPGPGLSIVDLVEEVWTLGNGLSDALVGAGIGGA